MKRPINFSGMIQSVRQIKKRKTIFKYYDKLTKYHPRNGEVIETYTARKKRRNPRGRERSESISMSDLSFVCRKTSDGL